MLSPEPRNPYAEPVKLHMLSPEPAVPGTRMLSPGTRNKLIWSDKATLTKTVR